MDGLEWRLAGVERGYLSLPLVGLRGATFSFPLPSCGLTALFARGLPSSSLEM
jgi:hypothetical protein